MLSRWCCVGGVGYVVNLPGNDWGLGSYVGVIITLAL